MMKRNIYCSLICYLLLGVNGYAQTEVISMPNDDVLNTCDLSVNPDNGGLAPYSASQNNVLTVCPVAPEVQVNLYFLDFDLSPGDTMFIYNGPDVSAPLITSNSLGDLQFQTISPDLITNPGGCLTINFISNADAELGAYNFRVTCGVPCAYPLANIEAGGDTLKICPGETVNFDASGSTAGNGNSFIDAPITEWSIDNSFDTSAWPVLSYQFNEPGGYRVRLNLEDTSGCASVNLPMVIVLVSTPYLFDISTTSDYFCVGNEVLIGTVAFVDSTSEFNDENQNGQPVTWIESQSVVFENGVYIPDNQGCLYAEINFNSFDNGDTIASPDDFDSIYFNIEHSYVGDIIINIICPDGSVMNILPAEAGSSTYLGEPIDIDDGVPGVGYTYSFLPNSTGGTWMEYLNGGGASPIPAGDYEPEGSFADLIGCPLNGTWQLEVCDVVGADDGWVFEFGVAFNASFYPDVLTFTPIIGSGCDSSYWQNPEQFSFVGPNCDWALFTPTDPGVYEFFYEVKNDFGCTFNDSLSITVRSPELNADSLVTCGDLVPTNVTVLDADQSNMVFSWSPGTFLSATDELSPDVINFSGGPIDYVVTVNITSLENCFDTAIVRVEYGGSVELGLPEQFDCDVTMPHEVVATPAGPGNYSYQWFPPNQTFPSSTNDTIVVTVDGIYRLIALAPCNSDTLDYHIAPPLPILSDTIRPCFQVLPTNIVPGEVGQQVDWVWNYYASDSAYTNNSPDLAAFTTTPGVDVVEEGGYYIATVSQKYCTESRDYLFHVIPEACELEIPNIFTPNGDGRNDKFDILSVSRFPGSYLKVFNRWGTLILDDTDYDGDWTANEVADGTYYYILGLKSNSGVKEYAGYVTILR